MCPLQLIGRLVKMLGELDHRADVRFLGVHGQIAHAQVVEHTLT
jgi:hypothetical protein